MYGFAGTRRNYFVLLVFFGFVVLLQSCEKWGICRKVEMLKRQVIHIPSEAFNTLSNDTKEYKLLVYVDSCECSSCFVEHIFLYRNVYAQIADQCDMLVVLSPSEKDRARTRHLLSIQRLPFPVWIDVKESFMKENPELPSDSRFHSFLLDKQNRPVVIGDPVKYPPILELIKAKTNSYESK